VADSFFNNAPLLATMKLVAGAGVDLEAARKAFETTPGDFTAKFTAAVQARLASMAAPEVFIEIPEDPSRLRRPELDALVRPVADGFLRSYPSKDELLEQVSRIKYRQQKRPSWIPRIDRNGVPLAGSAAAGLSSGGRESENDYECEPDRPLVVTALAELGDVTIMLPCAGAAEERMELAMSPGGVGEWESALFTALGLAGPNGPAGTITLDTAANEALVPEEARWWPFEPSQPLAAGQDPGVAGELLATSATLGGLPVVDDAPDTFETMAVALAHSGDWRYSSQWRLESWDPGDGNVTLTTARTAIAGWADETRSGIVVYVYGGALQAEEGQLGIPSPLHSHLLVVTRAADGTDAVAAVHRVVLSCPGEYWCHRGGCATSDFPEAATLLAAIAATAETVSVAADIGGPTTSAFQQFYGDKDEYESADTVLAYLMRPLRKAGWDELNQSTWEGGAVDALLRRGEHCLTVTYDPVTRQIQLIDGQPDLESTLQLLSDDGTFTEIEGQEVIDFTQGEEEGWGKPLLTAAEDLVNGRIKNLPHLARPIRTTILGLHPHADGTLRGPEASTLADHQFTALARAAGVLTTLDGTVQ
jgi:hypothetical protein